MKVQTLLAALAAGAIACTPVMAQKDAAKPQPPKPADKAPAAQPGDKKMSPSEMEAMQKMMEAGTPGEGQKNIEQLVGEWDAVVKYRMAAEAPWQENKGVESRKMMFEGRYLHTSFKGDMEGQPFHGAGIMAYNNTSKTYESTWIDSMSTCIWFSTGTYDVAKKSWSMKGDMADPMQGGKKKTTRIVETLVSSDRVVTEFFEPGMDGKEFNSMVISYTRKAASEGNDEKPGKGEKHERGEKDEKHAK